MSDELIEFRDAINQAIARGEVVLPVVGEDGIPMVIVALEDEEGVKLFRGVLEAHAYLAFAKVKRASVANAHAERCLHDC